MAGGLGLFLYGMTILSSGLEKASGGLMEKVLAKMTGNVFSGILFGALVTAAVQSSSATTVIVVGLVNAGLLKLKGAVWNNHGRKYRNDHDNADIKAHKPRGRQQRPCYIAALQAV